MNSTSFFYNHSNQWRYEKLEIDEILSPLADKKKWDDYALIDCNVRSERMGWLPSAPQLEENPLALTKAAEKAGKDAKDYVVERAKIRLVALFVRKTPTTHAISRAICSSGVKPSGV